MNNHWINYLFHGIAYYIVWFTCMFSAAQNKAWIGIVVGLPIICLQILWQYFIAKNTKNLLQLLAYITLAGVIIDSAIVSSGLVVYSDNIFAPYISPPWIMVIWAQFALIAQALLDRLASRYVLLSMLCLIGFPLAYFAGARIGAATLAHEWFSALLIGIIWAIVLPLIMYQVHHKDTQ